MRRVAQFAIVVGATPAFAGGMFLPGPTGAISTSRAGAAVASSDTGEALAANPAGLSKTHGTTITLSMAFIDYALKFQRSGTYDDVPNVDLAYEGQPYPLVEDGSKAAVGIGGFQPIPVFAVTTRLSAVPKLTLAVGMFSPNSYPFRDLCTRQGGACTSYKFNGDPAIAPNPARYDVVTRKATLFTPTAAASYRILPNLDIGARLGVGFASLESSVHVWSAPGNVVEDVGGDGLLRLKAKDNFVPQYGIGVAYRPTRAIELGAVYNSEVTIDAKGTAATDLGPRSGSSGISVMVVPVPDEFALCAPGGQVGALKACVSATLPRSAVVGGRYKFLGAGGSERGDIELDVAWENWGADESTNFSVKIDSELVTEGGGGLAIKPNQVRHGFRDVFSGRLGGSWKFPVGANLLTVRGGVAHDTAAARSGWLRADIDGAARTTIAVGAGFRTKRFQIDTGFGYVHAGKNTNGGECNPVSPNPNELGCNRDGFEREIEDREGPDPINPLLVPKQQLEAPVTRGVFDSRYLMFMFGASTWF